MNPVNLYISTCRYVIQINPQDPDTWVELYRYIPCLRQALSCCVCTRVFHCPMGPEFSKCHHHVCKDCLGGKMRLKPACGWCNDFDAFIEKPQLQIIVKCFKKLCEYIASSSIVLNLSSTNNGGTSGGNQLLSIIQEVMSIPDDLNSSAPSADVSALTLLPPVLQKVDSDTPAVTVKKETVDNTNVKSVAIGGSVSKKFKRKKKNKGKVRTVELKRTTVEKVSETGNTVNSQENNSSSESPVTVSVTSNTDSNIKSESVPNLTHVNEKTCSEKEIKSKISETVKAEHDYIKEFPTQQNSSKPTKLKSRRASTHAVLDGETSCKKNKIDRTKNSPVSDSKNNNNSLVEQSKAKQNKSSKTRSYGCRCGLATPKPGNLTCCGQRCPCYSAFRGCEECKCRGCRNPRGDPAKNPLAALRLQRQLQSVRIIQSPISQSEIENVEISETILPVHTSCMSEDELNIVDIDI